MDIIKDLAVIGEYQRTLPTQRAEAVEQARKDGHTWRAIAEALGMTQHAIISADRAYQAALASNAKAPPIG